MTSNASSQPAFRIFRKADAPHLNDTGAMTMGEMAPITAEGVMRWAGSDWKKAMKHDCCLQRRR